MEDWRSLRGCVGVSPAVFYPDPGQGMAAKVAAAKAICRECPVRVQCLDFAIRSMERDGIWGGVAMGELGRRRPLREAHESGDVLGYQAALAEALDPGPGPSDPGACPRCGGPVRTGPRPVDRNGPGAKCGVLSTYNRGCRCNACVVVKLRARVPRAG